MSALPVMSVGWQADPWSDEVIEAVVNAIDKLEPVTRQELSEHLGLSVYTTREALYFLELQGSVVRVGRKCFKRPGRPAVLWGLG